MKFTYPSGSRPLAGYTIKRGIGRGGFGEVYYATSDAGKEVALKLIRRNLEVELRGVTQCINLKHVNLLGLFDIKEDDQDDSWVVMEYVDGESLEDVIARHPEGMPLNEAMNWFHGVAAGVTYLHDNGIVHRDLKPGNIFSDGGVVKIGDYGLSKFISASRRSGQTESVGTVHYMAPEIANGRYGKEIDIYALGIILYEILTGHVPFEGESVGEVLMKHLTAEPDLTNLEEPFRGVVARCLTKDPEERIHSVGEVLAALPGTNAPSAGVGNSPALSSPPLRSGNPQSANGAARQQGGRERIPVAELVVGDDPVLRGIKDAWRQCVEAWDSANFNTPTKVILIIVGVIIAIQLGPFLFPGILVAALIYGAYRIVRAVTLTGGRSHGARCSPPPARPKDAGVANIRQPYPAPPAAEEKRQHARRAHQQAWRARRTSRVKRAHARGLRAMPIKSHRQQTTELIGSMLIAAAVVVAISVVMTLLVGDVGVEEFAWLALVCIAGCWGVMVPSKFWEGTRGEPILRRFVLLVMGLGLGVIAFVASTGLFAQLHYSPTLHVPPLVAEINPAFIQATGNFQSNGQPLLAGFVAYFGFLFPLLRWWRQADPLRPTRMSIWAVGVCVAWAYLLSAFWGFPQPWGMMVAATVSIAVQLSSPWIDPRRRTKRVAATA